MLLHPLIARNVYIPHFLRSDRWLIDDYVIHAIQGVYTISVNIKIHLFPPVFSSLGRFREGYLTSMAMPSECR
eukprot:SAG11_NODE_5_length_32399_cov_6.724118_10_plen_73_part_00